MRRFRTRRVAVFAAATVAAMTVGVASPATASASGTTLPTGADLQAIVNCTIALVDQLLLSGRPGSDCFGVP